MNVYTILQRDHGTIEQMLLELTHTTDTAPRQRRDGLRRLCEELQRHGEAEDQLFYPRLEALAASSEALAALVDDARSDHEEVDDLLDELGILDVLDDDWDQRMRELAEAVRAHVQEEENELFPLARQVLDGAEADALGREIAERARREAQQI